MVAHAPLLRPPLLIPRQDRNFVEGLFEDLKTGAGRQSLRQAADQARSAGSRLLQPIHRAANVLLIDVACDRYGYPRLDPEKIESAGLVVRRLEMNEKLQPVRPERLEGWFQENKKLRGWARFPHPADLDQDPDPKFRKAPFLSGNVEINRRLVQLAERHFRLAEVYEPAWVAPPEVCEAAERTLVFGVVPTASLETSEMEPPPVYSSEEMLAGFPTPFQQGPQKSLSAAALDALVRQAAFELGICGNEPQERALLAALDTIVMPDGQGAGSMLKSAYHSAYEQNLPITQGVTWPAIAAAEAERVKAAVFAVKQMRLSRVSPPTGRFEADKAYYRARMFVRVKQHPECPGHLHWSQYTDPFQIAPWYEPAGPPVKIPMPDIDRNSVKKMKPNVAFQLPPGLFNLLANNSPKDFLDGKGKEGGGGVGIAWICSFSLPIISLCAFIVLNIFLQLFNIVFFWLLYIKICIPIPIPKPKDS